MSIEFPPTANPSGFACVILFSALLLYTVLAQTQPNNLLTSALICNNIPTDILLKSTGFYAVPSLWPTVTVLRVRYMAFKPRFASLFMKPYFSHGVTGT
ncbi:hypothetical protein RRG08_037516 [Elysia crispata]|uniref:Secreted protein n=1 Tax=Elysia crispata TaxID=231223 RepID=A0AAE1A3D3_9GAST|nr:hypothetical protein RRG08_037516 [Elysia crispata]